MSLDVSIRVAREHFGLDVTLQVPDGSVTAVMGPNGCGKSTLLEAVAGLVPVTAGHVRLDGRTLADAATGHHVPPHARHLGVALQDGQVFTHLSARENVAFGARAQGTPAARARADADALLHAVGLAPQARVRAARLSGGQARRVVVARALAARPRALLLDEPFAGLDTATRDLLRDVVRRAVARGVAALLVTHDLRDALDLADELIVLEAGRVLQRGAPAAVARDPAGPYARRTAADLDPRPVDDGRDVAR